MKQKKKLMVLFITMGLIFIGILLFNKPVFAAETAGITDGKIYNIVNKASGKNLNVNLGTDANGTNVIQWTNDGSIEQKFRLVYYPNDKNSGLIDAYKLYAMCSSKGAGRVVDVLRTGGSASGAIQTGCNVDIWANGKTMAENDCQYWKITDRGGGYYSIDLKYNQSSLKLALTSYGTANGSGAGTSTTSAGNVFVSTYTGSANQLWKFVEVTGTAAFPFKHSKGIKSVQYFIGSSASTYTSFIDNAATSWNSTITLVKVVDPMTSAVDLYSANNSFFDKAGVVASTTYLTSSLSMADYLAENWAYAETYINNDIFLASKGYLKDDQRKGAIAHEMGHAFGLRDDYVNTSSIMYKYVDKASVCEPQPVDRTGITYKY